MSRPIRRCQVAKKSQSFATGAVPLTCMGVCMQALDKAMAVAHGVLADQKRGRSLRIRVV